MALMTDGPAPYAPPSTVLDIIDRFRHRGLQSPFTKDVLLRAGVGETLIQRITQALFLLGFIDDTGKPTAPMEALRKVPEAQFKEKLGEMIRAAYAEVFTFVDPGKDDLIQIRDAFRGYQPQGQQDRMVTLFLGLCEAADIQAPKKKTGPKDPASRKPTIRPFTRITTSGERATTRRSERESGALPPAISGLLDSLPVNGSWTSIQRDKFMRTFGAVLDYCIPIEEADTNESEGME